MHHELFFGRYQTKLQQVFQIFSQLILAPCTVEKEQNMLPFTGLFATSMVYPTTITYPNQLLFLSAIATVIGENRKVLKNFSDTHGNFNKCRLPQDMTLLLANCKQFNVSSAVISKQCGLRWNIKTHVFMDK